MNPIEKLKADIEMPVLLLKGVSGIGVVADKSGQHHIEIAVQDSQAETTVRDLLKDRQVPMEEIRIVLRGKNRLY